MFPAGLFKGKTVVITGGGTGLGAEMAKRLGELGARIAVLGRRKEKLDETVLAIERAGGRGSAHTCDVRDFAAVQAIADEVGQVHGLVNNAAGNFLAAAEDLTPNGFKAVVDIVLNGTFHCTSAFGRKMIEGKRGAIAFTRIPYAAHSTARDLVIASTPAFAHADGSTNAEPVHA